MREQSEEGTRAFAPSNLPSRGVPAMSLAYRDNERFSNKRLLFDINSSGGLGLHFDGESGGQATGF